MSSVLSFLGSLVVITSRTGLYLELKVLAVGSFGTLWGLSLCGGLGFQALAHGLACFRLRAIGLGVS